MKQQFTCYHCGKQIAGQVKHTVPPNISIMLGVDFPKAWHPICYQRAEDAAAKELFGEDDVQQAIAAGCHNKDS